MIKWPDRYHPSLAPVHVVNELTIPASCEQVWPWLIRAPLWPLWYPNSSDVRLVDRPLSELRLGTMFTWRTFGVNVKSTVQEFIPNERVAWSARGVGVDAYHAWLLAPCPSGTRSHNRRNAVRNAGAAAKTISTLAHETRAPTLAGELERKGSERAASLSFQLTLNSIRS